MDSMDKDFTDFSKCVYVELCSPKKEKKSMTEFSMISRRRWEALLASRVEPMFLFLRVACQSEYFPDHQIPATRKKLPGSAWPLKLPMTHNIWMVGGNRSISCRYNEVRTYDCCYLNNLKSFFPLALLQKTQLFTQHKAGFILNIGAIL